MNQKRRLEFFQRNIKQLISPKFTSFDGGEEREKRGNGPKQRTRRMKFPDGPMFQLMQTVQNTTVEAQNVSILGDKLN